MPLVPASLYLYHTSNISQLSLNPILCFNKSLVHKQSPFGGVNSPDMYILSQKETLSSEKEDLLAGMETVRGTVRQLEAQNQDLQKQLATLDKDLLAERAMKEHKIKVETRRLSASVVHFVY